MATVRRMVNSLSEYTIEDLEALERERPELGRVEIIDGALHATGRSVGFQHQLVTQRLHLAMAPMCPAGQVVMLDTEWRYVRDVGGNGLSGVIRADVGIYREDEFPDHGMELLHPPLASIEVLSDDANHALLSKDAIYAEFGARRAYVEWRGRYDWWWRADGVEHDGPVVRWQLEGWPPIVLEKAALLAPPVTT